MIHMRKITTMHIALTTLLLLLCSNFVTAKKVNKSVELYRYAVILNPVGPLVPAQNDDKRESVFDNPELIRIINLGKVVNWEDVDYAPTVSVDGKTLFFVSSRPGSRKSDKGDDSHDFWRVEKKNSYDTVFSAPVNLDTSTRFGELGLNTSRNEGVASMANKGLYLYFTGCNRDDGFGSCDLYVAESDGENWGKPVNLGKNVNSQFWDSQPSITARRDRIYFVSNRPSKFGKDNLNLWYSDYDFDMEEWKPAVALDEVNTPGKEVSPFIDPSGTTLFFASDGYQGFGGTDFYVSNYDEDTKKWSKPKNLGKPINTDKDEQFISIPGSGDIIYFASERTDLKGHQGKLDLFMAFVPSLFKTITVIANVIDECANTAIPALVTLRNPLTNTTDSLMLNTSTITEFQRVITSGDFMDPKDPEVKLVDFVEFEITATSATYGKTTQKIKINKPEKTKDREAAKESSIINVPLKLGKKPVLGSEVGLSEYTKKNQGKPEGNFKGLVMKEVVTIDLAPILNYIFFDLGSSDIPGRYIKINQSQTANFNDERLQGGTLEKYYHVLNIYGYRLNKYPNVKIEVVGCIDDVSPEEKDVAISKKRAENVYNYLRDVWKISPDRMKLTARKSPEKASKTGDPDPDSKTNSIIENRRVELLCTGDAEEVWQVIKPLLDKDPKTFPMPEQMNFTIANGIDNEIFESRRIVIKRGNNVWKELNSPGTTEPKFQWDWTNDDAEYPKDEVPYTAQLVVKSTSGAECSSEPIVIPVKQWKVEDMLIQKDDAKTLERYKLILFPFDSYAAGPLNDRIMREFVLPRCAPNSEIKVEGHTDIIGMDEYNRKLSVNRAGTVESTVKKSTGNKYKSLESTGLGETDPLYPNNVPEGRFYNRTVLIQIQTPIEAK
jgi:outer membrane protein OmpA-like peptidoglycan-associated protein